VNGKARKMSSLKWPFIRLSATFSLMEKADWT